MIYFQRMSAPCSGACRFFLAALLLQAAEQVCSGGKIKPTEVFDLLSHLIDKSFVMAESTGNTKRYRFQETIHQYSLERLKESKELGEFTRKHALFYLRYCWRNPLTSFVDPGKNTGCRV